MNAPAGSVPANIDLAAAKLPRTYEQAKQALTACNNIDECKDWSDKAEALASYAKQADDETLFKMARRIQARAVQRCGELLKQIDARGEHMKSGGAPISRREAADNAGLSKDQQVTAVRVANLPKEEFEAAIEAEKPASVTKLAEMGKQTREPPPAPPGFYEATHTMGAIRRLAERCEAHQAAFVAGGVGPDEAREMRSVIPAITTWLTAFLSNLKG